MSSPRGSRFLELPRGVSKVTIPSATKQTRCLISGLAEAPGDVGPSAGTGSEIKARLVAVEEDSLLGD